MVEVSKVYGLWFFKFLLVTCELGEFYNRVLVGE
jgi:hypothetical protein